LFTVTKIYHLNFCSTKSMWEGIMCKYGKSVAIIMLEPAHHRRFTHKLELGFPFRIITQTWGWISLRVSIYNRQILNSRQPKIALNWCGSCGFPTPPFWLAMAIILPIYVFLILNFKYPSFLPT
jgi:hypothetical protein